VVVRRLVFFGITGDLAYKQIFPALQAMIRSGHLDIPIVGVAGAKHDLAEVRARARDSLRQHGGIDEKAFANLSADLARGKPELIAENALLRQQLIVLGRTTKRPRLTPGDRALLVLLATRIRTWRNALLIVQPETLLRWHRAGFRLVWRWRSAPRSSRPRVSPETVELTRRMARESRLWGAERIRGELRKLGVAVWERTIQRHMRPARPWSPAGQTWATFLRNHRHEIWACDFLQLTDLLFRPLFAFFVVELGSRRVVHVGVTRSPTDAWVAQRLCEATADGTGPRFLLHDHDAKYGPAFARVATASDIEVIRTRIRAPRANAVCEPSSAASGGSAWTTRCCSASGTSSGCWRSTSGTSTARDRTKASAKTCRLPPRPPCSSDARRRGTGTRARSRSPCSGGYTTSTGGRPDRRG
jgi:putative transposase